MTARKFIASPPDAKPESQPIHIWAENVGGSDAIVIRGMNPSDGISYNIAAIGDQGIYLHGGLSRSLGFPLDHEGRIVVTSRATIVGNDAPASDRDDLALMLRVVADGHLVYWRPHEWFVAGNGKTFPITRASDGTPTLSPELRAAIEGGGK